ncbi:MAG: 30S ribosomal protein S13, partial [Candidatus Nanoarchaeia archaeon]
MAEEPKPTTAQPAPHAEFRDLIRIAEKDIKGGISTLMALTKVKGCDFMMANAVCNALNLDRTLKCGSLTQEQIAKIEDALKHPTKYGIPAWMLNHRKELETGVDKHLVASDLRLQNEMDIRYL